MARLYLVISSSSKNYRKVYFCLNLVVLFPPQWNISDYFFQRGEAIIQELEREEVALQKQAQERGETLNRPFHPAPPFDCLWLCLYAKLGELCVDPRPAVRKSAGQTLFSTIAAHGTLLQQPTWHTVVWKVTDSVPVGSSALSLGISKIKNVQYNFI